MTIVVVTIFEGSRLLSAVLDLFDSNRFLLLSALLGAVAIPIAVLGVAGVRWAWRLVPGFGGALVLWAIAAASLLSGTAAIDRQRNLVLAGAEHDGCVHTGPACHCGNEFDRRVDAGWSGRPSDPGTPTSGRGAPGIRAWHDGDPGNRPREGGGRELVIDVGNQASDSRGHRAHRVDEDQHWRWRKLGFVHTTPTAGE